MGMSHGFALIKMKKIVTWVRWEESGRLRRGGGLDGGFLRYKGGIAAL